MSNLTDAELRALAYYAIGVTSEGKDVAYKLSFCGNATTGPNGDTQLRPIGNSGYSIGEMQTDLGARSDTAHELVKSFQAWAQVEHPDWVLSEFQASQAGI